MTATLAVIGAGPKAVAVAAKAAELRNLGVDAPDVVVVERTGVGANWTAAGGCTDGRHRLGASLRRTSDSRTARRWCPGAVPNSTSG